MFVGQDFQPRIESNVVVFAVLSHLQSEIGRISLTASKHFLHRR